MAACGREEIVSQSPTYEYRKDEAQMKSFSNLSWLAHDQWFLFSSVPEEPNFIRNYECVLVLDEY